jgi:copper homeostasis protein
MKNKIKLEICCFSVQSAINANLSGADRVELCAGRPEGGTTPTLGFIENTLNQVNIPVYVMLRPRGGDFLYDKHEIETMFYDLKEIKKLNPAGIVFGALLPNGTIDIDLLKRIIQLADGTPITFHRAFDMTNTPFEALETLIDLGIENILTSGQKNKAIDATARLIELVKLANGKINIMAGSGINPQNLDQILHTGVDAVHFSATAYYQSKMLYKQPDIYMGSGNSDEYLLQFADAKLIREVADIIEKQGKK